MKRLALVVGIAALLSPVTTAPVASASTFNVDCSVSGTFLVSQNVVTSNTNCTGAATIPSAVTRIGAGAFGNATGLTAVTFAADSELTSIGDSAFFNTYALTTVTLPASLTTIEQNAFYNATALTSVTFPFDSEVTSIGSYAFFHASSLTAISIPRGVTTIAQGTFYKASALASVTFFREAPTLELDAFTEIAAGAVANVSHFSTTFTTDGTGLWNGFTVNKDSGPFLECSVSGGALFSGGDLFTANAFYDINQPCVGGIDIPPFITKINASAFNALTGLTSVRFWPNSSLTEVGRGAFEGATNLTSAELPKSVTTLGNDIFKSNTSLARFRFEAGSVLTSIPTSMFFSSGLTQIAIPDSVTTIGDYAFRNATQLTSVTFGPDSKLTSIGQSAFYGATSLTSVTLPKTLTTIGDAAFFNDSSLTSVTFPSDSALTSLGSAVFHGASSLTSFTFPAGITVVPDATFQGASNLISVTFKGVVTSFGPQAFIYTSNLTSLRFVGNAPTLNDSVFVSPPSGAKAYIPHGATGFDASGWSGLQLVRYSSCSTSGFVNYVGTTLSVNDGCTGTVTVASGTTTIATEAFINSTGLTGIEIPASVTSIGDFAFGWTSALAYVTFAGNQPTLGFRVFDGIAAGARVNVSTNATGFAMDASGKWSGLVVHRPLKVVTKPSLSGRTVSSRAGTNKLTVSRGAWVGGPRLTFTYQWYSCTAAVRSATQTIPRTCTKITGQKYSTLALTTARKGKYISVTVTAKIDGSTPITWLTKTSSKIT